MPVLIAPIGWLLLSCTSARPGASPSGSGVVCPSPTTWYADLDGDHYGAGAAIASSCVMPANAAANTDDCDDGDAAVNPSAVEVCNGIDDDCDGVVDPTTSADILSCYTDADRDGYGDPDSPVAACACTDGLSANADDCDDSRANAYPGAEEILYDGIDEACDGMPGEYDRDGDGYDWNGGKGVDGRDCDDTDPDINPTVLDLCDDDIDQDCDGVIDECGFTSMTDSSDAWLTVSRYADAHPLGLMGNHLAYAGDSDGDGRPEIVAYEGYYPVGGADHTGMTFRLVEAPSNTSGGNVDVDDVTIARWVYPDDDFGWTQGYSLGANEIDASQDFDGDGIVDYLFGNSGTWYDFEAPHDYSPNAISLWYGPPTYQDKKGSFMDMADAQTATITTGDVFFIGSFAVTVPPGGDRPWQLAAHLFPASQDLGSNHAALALLTDADFQGEEDPTDAPSIRTSDGYEAIWTVQSDDIDGDGFRDLVVTTRRYPDHTSPPVVMAFAGPFDEDRTMDSADLSIRGVSNDGYFGLSLDLSVDPTGDGYGKLLVGLPVGTNLTRGSLLLYHVGTFSNPQALGIHDAYAWVNSDVNGIDEDSVSINIEYQSRWLGDIDQDGIEEIGVVCVDGVDGVDAYSAYLLDAPTSGTVAITDATQHVYGDRDIDSGDGFGSWMDGRHDYDGDGWPDLVVGEFYWDGEPGVDAAPQGRFSIYRGENGPVGGS